ncbi:hypothetical protein NLU13_1626 [Sarocladium strictum]|uniref:Uncharacterized protein n=1 Tax=Sarocladium strictum TaxID=5046 RepID=A0AA39GSX1_SARSR|nr:hypothetical protein NLU13_1626 [Sarocladium strictum]
MGLVNAKNPTPERQRAYQAAYKAHTRLWKISPGARWYIMPYQILLWGTVGATLYAGGRKILGHNTWY